MQRQYTFQEAKRLIDQIAADAAAGKFSTRALFMDTLDRNPHVAAQGYNLFGKIFYWNEASSHLYGYREAEAVNQELTELILPPEMHQFARDMMANARKTGRMPDPSTCDLLTRAGEYVTVYSGHLVFQWEQASTPEFYCIDLAVDNESTGPAPLTTAP